MQINKICSREIGGTCSCGLCSEVQWGVGVGWGWKVACVCLGRGGAGGGGGGHYILLKG